MAFSLILHGSVPKDEICGVIVGHGTPFSFLPASFDQNTDPGKIVWYFFSDVYPSLHGGQRPLDPPGWWRRIFEDRAEDTQATPINNEIAAAAAADVR